MVAGLVMPLADLRAIYELLFRDGVVVAKKDKRPRFMHPDLQGVANLKVYRAMNSLKSKGYVRETFAWRHAYYYLTNEGIVYLRNYLHLPVEIVPASLHRPTSTLTVMGRAARVQTVEGPTSYVLKPKAGGESQEATMDRQSHRYRRYEEEVGQSDRPSISFRGSYQPHATAGQPELQTQTFFRGGQGFHRGEERGAGEGQKRGLGTSYLPTEDGAGRCPVPVKEAKLPTPSVPIDAPLVPEIPKEMPVAQEVIEPAFTPAVESATPAPSTPVQEVVEEVAAKPPAAVEESEPLVEIVVEVEEALTEEPTEELIPHVKEEDALKLVLEEPAEVIEEVVTELEHVKEDPQPVPLVEEPVEEEEEEEEDALEEVIITDMVVVKETPEDPAEEVQYDVEIELSKDPKQLKIEASIPLIKSKTLESDSQFDLPTPPTPVTDDFTDFTDTAAGDFPSVEITQKVVTSMGEAIPAKGISRCAALEADCPVPVVPSKCPVSALKMSQPRGDWAFTEDPEGRQEVKKVWPDSLEGLSSF